MPKILSPRFVKQHYKQCKACHSGTRKLCSLCTKCAQHCQCEDLPASIEHDLDRAFNHLRTSIHKLTIDAASGHPITEEDIYEALTRINFEEIMTRYFPAPKTEPSLPGGK
jgi:hypothetical protein